MDQISLTLMVMTLMLGIAIIVIPRRIVTDTGFRSSVSDTYDANDLAVVFAMGIPFIFYSAWRGGFIRQAMAVPATLLAAYGIYLTGSRGGLIALATVFLYMIFRVKELGGILRSVMVIGILWGGMAATQTSTFQQLISAVNGKDYNTSAEDGRLQVWKRGLGYIATHPLTGVGIVCFEDAEGNLSGRSSTAAVFGGRRHITVTFRYVPKSDPGLRVLDHDDCQFLQGAAPATKRIGRLAGGC